MSEKHLVRHHNMFAPACEVESVATEYDFEVYCHLEHKVCVPKKCQKCKFLGGSEEGVGVCCVWEESVEDMPNEEHFVQHGDAILEFNRVENPHLYEKMMNMPDDLDLCKAWQGLD